MEVVCEWTGERDEEGEAQSKEPATMVLKVGWRDCHGSMGEKTGTRGTTGTTGMARMTRTTRDEQGTTRDSGTGIDWYWYCIENKVKPCYP